MEKQTFFIEPAEEIVSIIDRLIQTPERQINLVIPPGAQIWQSSINLKLLRREANLLEKDITLIVSDDLNGEVAESAGLKVIRENDFSVELADVKAPKLSDKTLAGEKPALDENKDNMIDLLVEGMESEKRENQLVASKKDELIEKIKEKKFLGLKRFAPDRGRKMTDIISPVRRQSLKERIFPKEKEIPLRPEPLRPLSAPEKETVRTETRRVSSSPRWSKLFFAFIGFSIIVAFVVSYLVLPSAEIRIFPKTEQNKFDLSVTGSAKIPHIDEALNEIPLQEIKVQKTVNREFQSTGEKQLNEKASGIITVYNEYSSSPQTLVATTRFESPDGKIFRIPQTVVVPGATIEEGKIIGSSIDLKVFADQPGEEYNIGPANFTIPGFKGGPKFSSFYGRSKEAMTGGSTKKVKIVLKEDLEKAKEVLIGELEEEISDSIKEQIAEGFKAFEGGSREEITEVLLTAQENDQTEKFSVEIAMTVRALLYREEDLRNLIDLNLVDLVPDGQRPLSETQKIVFKSASVDWGKVNASFILEIEEETASEIDVSKIKSDLIGQEEVEVRKYLANQMEIEKAQVSFWPFWVKKIPTQEKKIEIIID